MAIGFRGSHAWFAQSAAGSGGRDVASAGGVAGDRAFLLAVWKPFDSAGSPAGTETEITEFADGSVANGNGTGSVNVAAYYLDVVNGVESVGVSWSGAANTCSVALVVFSKGAGEAWGTPLFATAAITNWTTSSQTVSASSTVAVPDGSVVIGVAGIRDDSATFTRPTTGIDVASGITWDGNYVEQPATHSSSTLGFDHAADSGYRLVTTGGTVTLRQTATLSAAETGSALWIVQGVTSAAGPPRGRTQIPQLLAH